MVHGIDEKQTYLFFSAAIGASLCPSFWGCYGYAFPWWFKEIDLHCNQVMAWVLKKKGWYGPLLRSGW